MVLGHPAQEQGCLARAGASPPLPAVPGPLSLQSVVHWLTRRRLCLSSGCVPRKASRERRPPGRASLACSSSITLHLGSLRDKPRKEPGSQAERPSREGPEARAALRAERRGGGLCSAHRQRFPGWSSHCDVPSALRTPPTGRQLCPGDTAQADVCLPAGLPPPTPERLSSVC